MHDPGPLTGKGGIDPWHGKKKAATVSWRWRYMTTTNLRNETNDHDHSNEKTKQASFLRNESTRHKIGMWKGKCISTSTA